MARRPRRLLVTPKEKQRRINVKRFQKEKADNAKSKFNQKVYYAEKALDEIKELSKELRPFLQNGAILLGSNWDQIMEDQIRTALDGVIRRPVVDTETGKIVKKNGKPEYEFIPVDPKEQMAARKHLIDAFPKLIPEEAKSLDHDPLEGLAEVLARSGGKMALEVEVDKPEHEPDENVVEGVARLIDSESTVDLTTANA